jgi:hypothetical protein
VSAVPDAAKLIAALDQAIAAAEAVVPSREPGMLPRGTTAYRIPAKQWVELVMAIRQATEGGVSA